MSYSLAEALWLHATETTNDLLVAYPTADRASLRALAADDAAREHITVTIDSAAHLDYIDATLGAGHPVIRVCLDLDMSWRPLPYGPVVQVGTWRSPLRTPAQAALFAETILRRPGFSLVAVLGYEGQIAGLGECANPRVDEHTRGADQCGVHLPLIGPARADCAEVCARGDPCSVDDRLLRRRDQRDQIGALHRIPR